MAAGAYANPTDGALFLFKGAEPAEIEAFVKNDPVTTPVATPVRAAAAWALASCGGGGGEGGSHAAGGRGRQTW